MTDLHRPVPMYGAGMAVPQRAANFESGRGGDGTVVADDGDFTPRQVSTAPCVGETAYDWRLR